MLKSSIAVIVGLLSNVILSILVDTILKVSGVLPYDNLFVSTPIVLFVLGYRIVFSILGCYLTARLAPKNPMLHSYILGGIGLVLGIAGVIFAGHLGPWWYAWSLVVLTPPIAYLGGKIYLWQESSK
ncbi:hypothetical protein EHQ68_16410 [Leptospira congkakensis]|uniref:Uncharacterized protein n=1 Tax=Leptospira congkakensis TaxID=2484932 RepID=A0A4Z1ABM1_9LEPT|nr:hypothetical protein [Leptospira congkakensis]TGL86867.1 hypothetical protein EHQ68_16410 [Leptospira congkakensis]TGL93589.1 hypothetical protein EHQ69_03620 [Leptospira congkakensis]TGL95003.1 hypothetical protein EHQ70_17175 [Leptospira congkakensis]